MTKEELYQKALEVRQKAHAPYSKFFVGAALETEDGEVFCGCNVENASYGLTNCAERTAIFKMVSEGKKKIKAMAIVGDVPGGISPCGACRQVLSEFAQKKTPIYCFDLEGKCIETTVGELLPFSFSLES